MNFLKAVPTPGAAHAAAEGECAYTADLAEGFPSEVWITVPARRDGRRRGKRHWVFSRLMVGPTAPIRSVTAEESSTMRAHKALLHANSLFIN
jgi:hypothetical protein